MRLSALVGLLLLSLALCAVATSDTPNTASEKTEYDIQAIIWEQHALFKGVLDWALQKNVLTSKQVSVLKHELAERIEAFAADEGSDAHTRRIIYSFISTRLSVPSLLAGFGLILLFIATVAAVAIYISSPVLLLISVAGITTWLWISIGLGQSVQWQVLGVCISVIPAALVSTASYGLLMLIGLPNSPYEFLLPEASTIIFSLIVYYKYHFTFLLVPALVAGYMMWIDITCIFSGKTWRVDLAFFHASWMYGLVTILCGAWQENATSHFGFWFYMVGGFAFVGGLLPFILMSSDLLNEVIFLTSVACMVYAGTTAQRSILLIYGGVGITIYVVKSAWKIASVTPAAMYVRALFSVLFFSLSVIRYTTSGNSSTNTDIYRFTFAAYAGFAEFGCGFWLLVLHTLSWLPHVSSMQPLSRSRVLYFLAHLLTTIGLVGLSRVMVNMHYGVIKLIYDVDCGAIVAVISGVALMLNHCSALLLDIGLGFGPKAAAQVARNFGWAVTGYSPSSSSSSSSSLVSNPPSNASSSPSTSRMARSNATGASSSMHNTHIRPGSVAPAALNNTNFRTSRVFIIMIVGLLSYVIDTPTFARSSIAALLFLIWVEFIYKSPTPARQLQIIGTQFAYSTLAFLLSHAFGLDMMNWACLICMFVWTHKANKALRTQLCWTLLISWLSLAVVLNSPIVLGVATLQILSYFVHLSGWAKRHKQAKTRAFSIIGLVLVASLAFAGYWLLDYLQDLHRAAIVQLIALASSIWEQVLPYGEQFLGGQSTVSAVRRFLTFLAWPLPLSDALISEGSYILSILIFIGVITVISETVTWLQAKYWTEVPIDEDLPAIMDIPQMTVHFPNDTNQNGIVIGLKGDKPDIPFEIDNAALHIIGDEFWSTLSVMYGAEEIEAFRKSSYPFKLFPNRMSKKHFNDREDPQMWIHFGTGVLKEPSFSQSNIRSTLRKLVATGDPEITIRAIYSSRKANPKKGVLFEFDVRSGLLLNSIREGFAFAPIVADW